MEMEVPKEIFNRIRGMLAYKNQNENIEFECRYNQFFTKEQFMNAIAYYKSQPLLKFTNSEETLDVFTKGYRITIQGKANIQKYCATNILQENQVKEVITKRPIKGYTPVYMNSLNFKIDIKEEVPIKVYTHLLSDLQTEPKMFRFKKRFSFTDQKSGLRFDLTISKTSTSNTHKTFVESGTTNASDKYELEIESTTTTEDPYNIISKMVEAYMIITGNTGILINKDKIVSEYLSLIKQPRHIRPLDVYRKPKRFMVGPQPVSIERKNIVYPSKLGVVNLTEGYTVTEKTDGERHLMYIDVDGNVMLINSRFDIMPLGVKLNSFKNSVIDGEWVADIKMFAMFDAYYIQGVDICDKPLIEDRMKVMKDFFVKTKTVFEKEANITLHLKDFLYGEGDAIFELSKQLLDKAAKHEFPYEIDGLIYTPAHLSVGAKYKSDGSEKFGTWQSLIKWKPPDQNTIDFLVKYERDVKGKPIITIKNGKIYYVANLYVGFQPSQWEKINAATFIEKGLPEPSQYMARRFIPPDYVGDDICVYHADPDFVEDDSIVEFSYDSIEKSWVYLRTRRDKTESFRKSGLSGTANDYGTAMNIWRSIQNPVTSEMISGLLKVSPDDVPDDNVYYSRNTTRDKFSSRSMMDFHNHWVKNYSLIGKEAKSGGSLLDLACGKGGDLNKWIKAGLKDVVGFDYVADNIENPIDGVYARLSNVQREIPKDSRYIFLPMDCSKSLSSKMTYSSKDKEVARVLWGEGQAAGSGQLLRYWGMMKAAFDIVSCQFAIHYFFESEKALDTFIDNVDKYIKPGGRFIGTCLDGAKVKMALKSIPFGKSISGKKGDRIIWDITKQYTDDNKVNIGDAVDIYMESIGRVAREYLVNLSILEKRLKDKGYTCIFIESFDDVYQKVVKIATGDSLASLQSMTSEEKQYSFMNCMFCFEKTENQQQTETLPKPQEDPQDLIKKPKLRLAVKKTTVKETEPEITTTKVINTSIPEVVPKRFEEKKKIVIRKKSQ